MASSYLSQTNYNSFGGMGAGPSGQTGPMYQTASNFATPQGGSRIKVAVRIRPLLEHEKSSGHETQKLKVQGTNEVV